MNGVKERVTICPRRSCGAALLSKGFRIWIDDLRNWPNEMWGKSVSVTGVVIGRYDLTVFIPSRRNRGIQGIPIPKGTDLHNASHRYLLKDTTWKLQWPYQHQPGFSAVSSRVSRKRAGGREFSASNPLCFSTFSEVELRRDYLSRNSAFSGSWCKRQSHAAGGYPRMASAVRRPETMEPSIDALVR